MVDSFVQSKLRDNKVTLFVKGSCPYCKNAIALLKEFNFLPGCLEVVDITGMDDIQDYFQKTTGQRTVSSGACFGISCQRTAWAAITGGEARSLSQAVYFQ